MTLGPASLPLLRAIVGTLVPGDEDFPPAESVPVAETILERADAVRQGNVSALLDRLSAGDDDAGLLTARSPALVAALRRHEDEHPASFAALIEVTYYCYYAQPAVGETLRRLGHDVNEAPQPRGYAMRPWTSAELPSPARGTFVRTEDVRRLELPAELVEGALA